MTTTSRLDQFADPQWVYDTAWLFAGECLMEGCPLVAVRHAHKRRAETEETP